MDVASHHRAHGSDPARVAFGAGGFGAAEPDDPVHLHRRRHRHRPMLDAEYWVANVRQPVRFSQAITTAAARTRHLHRNQPTSHYSPTPSPKPWARPATTASAPCSATPDDTFSFHSNLNSSHTSATTHRTRPNRIRSYPPPPGITRTTGYPSRIQRGQPFRAQTRHPAR